MCVCVCVFVFTEIYVRPMYFIVHKHIDDILLCVGLIFRRMLLSASAHGDRLLLCNTRDLWVPILYIDLLILHVFFVAVVVKQSLSWNPTDRNSTVCLCRRFVVTCIMHVKRSVHIGGGHDRPTVHTGVGSGRIKLNLKALRAIFELYKYRYL